MKKVWLLMLFLLAAISLFGCTAEKERVFDYQDKLSRVTGTVTENGREYKVEMCFAKDGEGKIYCRRIEYLSPKELEGLIFTLEGENITAEADGVRIADSWFVPESVFRFQRLFSFSETDVFEIKTKNDKNTYVKGKNTQASFFVVTDREGMPKKITLEDASGSTELSVEKLILTPDEQPLHEK